MKALDKLDQQPMFIEKMIPMDFTRNMGCYALEVHYTNGDTQMLTTKSTNPNVYQSFEFDDLAQLTEFYEKYK